MDGTAFDDVKQIVREQSRRVTHPPTQTGHANARLNTTVNPLALLKSIDYYSLNCN